MEQKIKALFLWLLGVFCKAFEEQANNLIHPWKAVASIAKYGIHHRKIRDTPPSLNSTALPRQGGGGLTSRSEPPPFLGRPDYNYEKDTQE